MGQRVAQQVDEHLAQPRLVTEHHRRPVGRLELDAARGVEGARVVHRVRREGQQVDGGADELAVLVEPGEQQHLVDELAHPRGLALHPAHDAVEVRPGRHGALAVELGEPPDARQRRAQLVAGVADEPAQPRLGLLLRLTLRGTTPRSVPPSS